MTEETETLEFRAEVQQLLHILAHSLYTEREIFVRELISNSSDALHRVQFEMLTNRNVLDPDAELAIRISVDEQAHTLTIADTGIGMTRQELIENLGTIAHSGVRAFLQSLQEGQRLDEVIGQFGVGFYSVFMVAEEVVVTTRSCRPDEQAWRWSSRGDDRFTLAPAEKAGRGTVVEVRLKEDAWEFASPWRLEQVVRKHSDYVSFPIYIGERVVNRQTALWRKPPADVEPGEYDEFYRQLTLDPQKPLAHVHLVTDAPVHIRALLFLPRRRERGLPALRPAPGLRLYSRKVLIQEHNSDLLPEYLQFIEGVVDSEDLPLNVSREAVQSSPVLRHLRKALTGRAIRMLRDLAESQPADYRTFWVEFGPFIKQGVTLDLANRQELLPLLRFDSSKSAEEWITLDDYVGRMGEGQTAIYYLLGEDRETAGHSPHLDAFVARDLEVLYLLDPLDGFMIQALGTYADRPFRSVDDPDLELPGQAKAETEEELLGDAEFERLAARCKEVLGERVSQVRASRLLRDSPCRLVAPGAGARRDVQRVRRLLGERVELAPQVLELNPAHPLIRGLAQRTGADDPLFALAVEQLFENLLLLEGLHPNPAHMVPRIQTLVEAAVSKEIH